MNTQDDSKANTCPCGSGLQRADCCQALINGDKAALTAEQLMRSRYTAYALENMEYIRETWHPSTRPQTLLPQAGLRWQGLQIVDATLGEARQAFVEFIARFSLQGQTGEQSLHERSRFINEQGRWWYLDGVQLEQTPQKPGKVGRNAPCICGSGRKYKKCCGQ